MAQEIEEQHVEPLSSIGQPLCVKNFIWAEEEWPTITYENFADGDGIPTISFREIKSQNYETLCKTMVDACTNWGFFRLVDHGVPLETIEKVKLRWNELFDLPMEQKLKGARSACLPLGYCATNPDYGKDLPWAEILQLLQSPQQVVAFASKVFGDEHQPFSDAMIEYMQELDKLGMTIFEMLAHGLGLTDNFFTQNFEEKDSTMIRVHRYPPCPLPEKCLGLGSHSDPHTLTILLQDDVGGLQILKSDSQWIGVRPIPNSFVINVGDTLEAWTNGRLKSVVHRAVVNKEKQRLSSAYFLCPTSSAIIACPPQLMNSDTNPRKYSPFTWGDFRKQLLVQKRVQGKTALKRYLI
ncbi:gibberellin 20 oxidase 1-like [Juglans microcarpa x Juglans regia]|uniref:gibberellin 20 oxidase 1-like n=1 Tax=Juglans microcarpa x Juglans regia TaxID=2249226 RepID=UPI001B7EFAE6|nr:gibberellin 20 oxidase 1-like [Juglans microcarpa x Juglans regia]